MPFTDAGDDEWTAIVNWGDGSSQSVGTIGNNPTGAGWHDVAASHTYLRAGTFRGEVCVTDDLDEGSCFTFRAVVDNLPPVVEAGPDIDAEPDLVSGATLSLEQATFTDPGTNDDHTATIDWGDGTPLATATVTSSRSSGGTVTGTHTYAADGIYEVEVCVSDQAGGVGCDTLDVDVRVVNQAPVALVEAPAEEVINVEVLLGGGFTDPNPDDTHTMTIDPGDGTGVQPLPLQSGEGVGSGGIGHVYADPGIYDVTACVTDAAGESDCSTTPIEALDDGTANQPPVADPGGPYVVDEGTTVTLDASGSSDPEGGDVTIAWDVDGDGSYETPGATLDVDADDGPGSISIEFEVCDAQALCAMGTAVVQISGLAPTITALAVEISGTSADASVSFTDPSPTDTHTVVVDWGDGSPADRVESSAPGGGTVSLAHTYAPGTWTLMATVTDDDGDETTDTTEVVVSTPTNSTTTTTTTTTSTTTTTTSTTTTTTTTTRPPTTTSSTTTSEPGTTTTTAPSSTSSTSSTSTIEPSTTTSTTTTSTTTSPATTTSEPASTSTAVATAGSTTTSTSTSAASTVPTSNGQTSTSTSPGIGLPSTGSEPNGAIRLAVLILLLGALVLAIARRRRHHV